LARLARVADRHGGGFIAMASGVASTGKSCSGTERRQNGGYDHTFHAALSLIVEVAGFGSHPCLP
ncbi:hypothetical protein, partial [Mesorhizobium sp. M0633]|uniref:hypothetical protein n=2 Tax=Mesorhizobium TaxID=68287 RepID=UPI00333D6F6E